MSRTNERERMADEELMRLVADADADAFEVIYDRHCQAVYSLCYRIAGSRSLADDVCQEAFLSLWRSAGRYDAGQGSVRSWALSIAHNRAIDQLRRATRHEDRRLDDDGDAVARQLPSEERTDVEALRQMDADATVGLLADLPAAQRDVIQLSFYSGYSQTEIASILELPLGTVKGRMRLGLKKLEAHMSEEMVR